MLRHNIIGLFTTHAYPTQACFTETKIWWALFHATLEAAARIRSLNFVFLEISQYSQENTCVGVSF